MVIKNKKVLLISLKLLLIIVISYLAYKNWNSESYQAYRSFKVKNINTYKSLLSHDFKKDENINIKNAIIFLSLDGKNAYFLDSPLSETEKIEKQIKTIEDQLDILERLRKNPEQFFSNSVELYKRLGINVISDFKEIESFKIFLNKYKRYGVDAESQAALNDFLDVYTKTLNKKLESISKKQSEKIDKSLSINSLGVYDKGIRYDVDHTFSKIERIKLRDLFYGVRVNNLKGTVLKIEKKGSNKYITIFFSNLDFIKNYAKSRYFMIFCTILIILLIFLIILDFRYLFSKKTAA